MASSRQLAALMYTDIVGYTATMQHDEGEAVTLAKRYLTVLSQVVQAHSGKILNDYGDGSLCVFSSALEATIAAMEIQQQLHAVPLVPLRIGLHIGEIFFEEGKVFGDGVNVASRIQSLGIGGSVLFSREVYETIKNHPEFIAVSLGRFKIRSSDEPDEVLALANEGFALPERVQLNGKPRVPISGRQPRRINRKIVLLVAGVLLVGLAAFFALRNRSGPLGVVPDAGKDQNSIAVLYFSNLSGDPGQEYFSDGITEEIITRLSMIEGMKVKSRSSVLQYKGKSKSARQIARELGVRNILEGSVRKQGNQLRVTAQLIDAAKDEHIWAENYDRELRDVFAVQSDIAQHIAGRFQIELSEKTRRQLSAPLTLNMEAYDFFLKARSLSSQNYGLGGDRANRLAAIRLLHRALQLDPDFAEAYALLSTNYSVMSWDTPDPQRWIDSALLLAQAAVSFRPDKMDGYEALATVYETTGDIDEALRWTQKANEVEPFSLALKTVELYDRKNDYGKAMEWILLAIRHDPTEPRHYYRAALLFYDVGLLDSMKRYIELAGQARPDGSDAVWASVAFYRFTHNEKEYARVVREINSGDQRAINYDMGILYLFTRQWEKADSLYRHSTHPDDIDAALVKFHVGEAATGIRFFEKALELRLGASGFWDHWRYYDVARIYAALEDPRYAEYLQKALDKGWHEYPFFEQDPFFDAVRPTHEFQRLAEIVRVRNERFKAELLRSLRVPGTIARSEGGLHLPSAGIPYPVSLLRRLPQQGGRVLLPVLP